ncbi:MAG: hypothetical protein HUU47_06505 [Bacteroidetes bacterium]|nr:hypothetical protein [Bacteroidota bacterium]
MNSTEHIIPILDGIVIGVLILSIVFWINSFLRRPKVLFPLAIVALNISCVIYSLHIDDRIYWTCFIVSGSLCFLTIGDLKNYIKKIIKWYISITSAFLIASIVLPLFFDNENYYKVFLLTFMFWFIIHVIIWAQNINKIAIIKVSFLTYSPSFVGTIFEILRQTHIIADNSFTFNFFGTTNAISSILTILTFLKLVEDLRLKKKIAQKENEQIITEQNILLEKRIEERTHDLEIEKKKSDDMFKKSEELLLNIIPKETAEELRLYGRSQAKTYGMVTVMFTDFKDFSKVSEKVSPELLVSEIDYCFSNFDDIIEKYSVEKIKTVGDAYICVGGMPILTFSHAEDTINAAIEIRNFILERKREKEAKNQIPFEIRIGIHTGPVVAGIVGKKKFAYDIWGDTVNIAARMEQNSESGKINISDTTYQLVKDKFQFTYRGKIKVKNKGDLDMYFVEI